MNRTRGVTLVELVIAMAVLAVGLLGIISAITAGLKSNESAKQSQLAMAALQDKLSEIRAIGYNATTNSTALFALAGDWTPSADILYELGTPGTSGKLEFLTEREARAELGSAALDLDRDGSLDEDDAANASFICVVARLSITWTDLVGPRTSRVAGIIYPKAS